MENYKIFIRKVASDELARIPKKDGARIVNRIRSLAIDPRPRGAEKLSARGSLRIRQGDYRIIYNIDEKVRMVAVEKVGHRREIYRKLGA